MITFTTQDLQVLKTVTSYPNDSEVWNHAFEFYNQENEKKISRSCPPPGYLKVLKFIEDKLA